jgi:DNA repair exonuclease SbcCD ATPase subunit
MKIINLKAENIKKLVAIDISPVDNVVKITGKNGQGKTSVLDAIWWCLAGSENIQSVPIRTGSDEAYVTITVGDLTITRKFRYDKHGEITSSLTVLTKDGAKMPSPQAVIDKLLGDLTFDPLAFGRMDTKKQFEVMQQFVPSIDFAKLAQENKADYESRTLINAQVKQKSAQVSAITQDPELDMNKIVVNDLLKQMESAQQVNAEIARRESERQRLLERRKELNLKLSELQFELTEITSKLSFVDTTEPVDISKISEQIRTAERHNAAIDEALRNTKLKEEVAELKKSSDTLTEKIKQRETSKCDAIKSANIPVSGISFGDNQILLNGLPFNQASDAEQLRASMEVAMALNPKLKIIRVRDGSLLDSDSMKIVEKVAKEKDFQIWIEIVDSSGQVGFVLEAGEIKNTISDEIVEY